ncbi:AMP-binding protein [Nocardioides alcanivorans]|uniref:AMP-binding protein n=1 Tax=Nocardioides alcanivorans TaxID=2897352 RepID=UPI001F212C4B|nr:AMP-binding protein [Nocardioides alcanivorans]
MNQTPAPLLGTLSPDQSARTAVVMGGSGRSLTFGELEEQSLRIAHLFDSLGLRRGDHVALLMENGLEVFPVAWAAQRSGLFYTPVNWHLTAAESRYIIDNCDARVLVHTSGLRELAAEVLASGTQVEHHFLAGDGDPLPGGRRLAEAAAAFEATPRVCEEEGHPMLYSSGTTGRPKGIVPELPGEPFGSGLPIDKLMAGLFGFGPTSVYLSTGPLYHAAPLAWSIGANHLGGTVVAMETFDAERALQLIEQHQVTHAQFVPTMFVRMLQLHEETRSRHRVDSLEQVIHAAAPCAPDVKRAIIDWLGPVVTEYYAGSEVNGFCTLTTAEWLDHPGSVGRAVLGEVHVCGPDGQELPAGEIGQVWFSGSRPFEYHRDPDKTAAAFNAQGWSTLGDLGHLDEDGYLHLSDRRTDLIVSGGVNIYPREVEDALCLHPDVRDLAVVGVPDPDLGHRVHAVIELRDGLTPSPELEAALDAHLRERIAGFKVPRSYSWGEVPRLPSGKVLRRVLMEELANTA